MKKLPILLLIIATSGCSLLYTPVEYPEIPVIGESVLGKVWHFGQLFDAPAEYRNVQNDPIETWRAGNGDCLEISIFDLYVIQRDLNIKGNLMTGWNPRTESAHAWIEVEGIWYDAVIGWWADGYLDKYENIKKIDYETAMWHVQNDVPILVHPIF